MNKLPVEVEQIFSQAVALDQAGGLRNTIYAIGHEIYILNYDHTVLLRFRIKKSLFASPVCFRANDYDGDFFEEVDGKIVFTTEKNGFMRTKTVGGAEYSPDEIKEVFNGLIQSEQNVLKVELSRDVLSLFDEELSHIEFSGKKDETLKMLQRNIYSGGIIQVQENMKVGMGLGLQTVLADDFGPIGIKTNDFMSLFRFYEVLKFYFPLGVKEDFIRVQTIKRDEDKEQGSMTGLIACCLYDEIIQLKSVQNGGQK